MICSQMHWREPLSSTKLILSLLDPAVEFFHRHTLYKSCHNLTPQLQSIGTLKKRKLSRKTRLEKEAKD